MLEDIQHRLHQAVNADEVKNVLLAACARHGKVAGADMACTKRAPRKVTCFVEMEETVAGVVAKNLGTSNLGTRLVVFSYMAAEHFQA